jgi:hypothetical protein
MVLHRVDRQVHLARDQLVRQALQEQRQHVALARRQAQALQCGAGATARRRAGDGQLAVAGRRPARAHRRGRHGLGRRRNDVAGLGLASCRPHHGRHGVALGQRRPPEQAQHDRRNEDTTGEHHRQCGQHVVALEPAWHAAHGPELDHAHHLAGPFGAGQGHDRQLGMVAPQADQPVAATRHLGLDVQQAEVEAPLGAQRPGDFRSVRHGEQQHVVAHLADHRADRGQHQGLLIDQQHLHPCTTFIAAAHRLQPARRTRDGSPHAACVSAQR